MTDLLWLQTRDDEKWMKHSLGYVLLYDALFVETLRFFKVSWVMVETHCMSVCRYWENDRVRLDYRPVHMNTLDDEVESFPPKARVY